MNGKPITALKGIGEKTAGLFAKIGVKTVEDLLQDYPRAYDAYSEPVPIRDLPEGEVNAAEGQLLKDASLRCFQNMQVVTVTLKDMTGSLELIWYNMPYIRTSLPMGRVIVVRGMATKKKGRMTMQQPEIHEPLAYRGLTGLMQPIYGQTKGLGNKTIRRAVRQALDARGEEPEFMPDEIRRRQGLVEHSFAVEHIHFPTDREDMLLARKRLVFDEFFFFVMSVCRLKEKRKDRHCSFRIQKSTQVDQLQRELPYALTAAQQRAWDEVRRDLGGELVMNRLIQGDVGSGKTIIAVFALLEAAYSGCQGALMAPTEVLARQHYKAMTELFAAHGIDREAVLVTGSLSAREKKAVYEKIARHEADIIIGTHALIQEKIEYDRLALVITDEQHRFGVEQREALGRKGDAPHILVMSATPIPRTLAIILYGDLDISVIDELPGNRLPVKNCVVDTGYRDRAYQFIAKQVQAGHQAYVICPMVEDSELAEGENVLDYTRHLRKKLPSGITVEYLHGKMRPKEKTDVMERFAAGEIQVLVSTTVVEVGVNVPNATVMMIENAERFGLAQLHQLRGRVGRGKAQSYCIMVNVSGREGTWERLDIMNHSNDGFFIAAEDLRLRGPGDFFGIRQSGDIEFRLADIFTDANILKMASEEVSRLLEDDPGLVKQENQELAGRLGAYLDKCCDKLNI